MQKKSGSIAIPFLITMLVTLLLAGGAAYYFYRSYTKDDTAIQPMPQATASITDADKMTILFILDTKEPDVPPAFMLYRFNPVNKKCFSMALPNNMQLSADGKTAQVKDVYTTGGVSALKSAVAATLSLPVDRYVLFDSTSFIKICDIIGGVECVVGEKVKGIPQSDEAQFLSGEQMQLLLTHEFSGGELQRSALIGSTISEMLNQMDNDRILQTLDSTVSTFLNITNTDLSALDYKEHKHALHYMVEFVPVGNFYLFPVAIENNGTMVLTDDFITSVQEKFN